MNRDKAKKVMKKAFAALTPEQQANLRWHAERGTKILCGKRASEWACDGAG